MVLSSSRVLPPDIETVVDDLCLYLTEYAVHGDRNGGVPLDTRKYIRRSGLLLLSIPVSMGGLGWSWSQLSHLIRRIARADSSIAHLLSYHYLGLTIPLIFGEPSFAEHQFRSTVAGSLFWCNALNPLDRRTQLLKEGDTWRLYGSKNFCSGSVDSDVIPTTARLEDTDELAIVILPSSTHGVLIIDDWDGIGQRQTNSGTIRFEGCVVPEECILYPSRQGGTPFSTLRTLMAQLNLANLYLGIAEGAWQESRNRFLVRHQSTVDYRDNTVAVLARDRFARLWVQMQAANAHFDRSLSSLQACLDRGRSLSSDDRGDCAVSIAITKVLATEISLDISSALFDHAGARFVDKSYGLDRFWRNIRTLSLHDPLDIKLQEIGNHVLNGIQPVPDFYS